MIGDPRLQTFCNAPPVSAPPSPPSPLHPFCRAPDHAKYPCLGLAYASGRTGGTMTGVLSAANEQAVELFLEERIGYLDIVRVVEACCDAHRGAGFVETPSLEEIVHYDQWARRYVAERVGSGLAVAA